MKTPTRDPVVDWLLRQDAGLSEGGPPSEHEVLATYWAEQEEAVFAFCRHGLLLKPGGAERYIPYGEIAEAGYYDREMIERAKSARVSGEPAPLRIRLEGGETIEIPLGTHSSGIPHLLTIANIIHRRDALHRGRFAASP